MPKARTDESGEKKRTGPSVQTVVRARVAQVVRVVFLLLAAVLAVGAILVVLRDSVNEQNNIVRSVLDLSDAIAGPFNRTDGVFDFSGDNAEAKNALVNWGIAAIVYLVLGRLISRLVAPRGTA